MRYFRKILGISYFNHVTNEEVRNIIAQCAGSYEDLPETIKKRKLKWYSHVTRSGLSKIILQGTVQGKRRQGRQKRWIDNIKEWTGMDFAETQALTHNYQGWRQLVDCSSVMVPQRPKRLWE